MMNEWKSILFKSEPPQTPFAPSWDFSIAEKIIKIDLESLADIILEKEKEIKMNAIYDFKLKSIKLIDESSSSQASEDDTEE